MNKLAFPTIKRAQYHNVSVTDDSGMTLRDYFAAKVAQGIYSRVNWNPEDVAERAYIVADEMMKERSK